MSKLDTAHGPFVELVGPGRVFVVPDYQRPYSWKPRKQVADLWGDILRMYRNRVDHGIVDTHFIGSVVIGEATARALGPVECPIIDGQQRLITLSLIVAAIRDALLESHEERTELTAQYLGHFKGEKLSAVRVRAGEQDRATFEDIVRGTDPTNVKNNVYRAYEYILEQLNKGPSEDADPDAEEPEANSGTTDGTEEPQSDPLPDDEAPDDPEDEIAEDLGEEAEYPHWDWEQLLSVVGTQLELVSISDVAPENAYQIFGTLNSTGLPLSQVDLVRNAVFMLMPKGGARAHKELWVPMEKVMGKELLQSYLHTWIIRKGHNVPAKEIYRSTVFELSRVGTKELDVRRVLQTLNQGSWAYLLVTRPNTNLRSEFGSSTVPKPIVSSLSRLRDWKTVPMEPVLVEIVERFRAKSLTQQQAVQALAYLESFVVRRFVAQVPPNDLRSIFARLTQQVANKVSGSAFVQGVLDGLNEKSRRWPTDAELQEAFVRRPLYRSPGQRQSFYVLKRIAEKMEGKESPHIAMGTAATDFSIEHVLPQSFPEAWQRDLKKWKDPNPQETWQLHRHTAGNLTLTAYNSELSALPFIAPRSKRSKKRWIEDNLRLQLSKDIVKSPHWTRAEIEARSKELAQLSLTIWPHPEN